MIRHYGPPQNNNNRRKQSNENKMRKGFTTRHILFQSVALSWLNKKTKECKDEVRPSLLMTSNKLKERSDRTADSDQSDWSGFEIARGPANLIGDTSCPADRQLKGCLKIKSQRESLARIVPRPRPPSSARSTTDKATYEVLFDSVEIREYHRMLSDNPACSGAPIGIGWRYDTKDTIRFDLDEYERCREGLRRTKEELVIPPDVREDMLRKAGFSRRDIVLAIQLSRNVRAQRAASIQQLKLHRYWNGSRHDIWRGVEDSTSTHKEL